MDPHSTPRLAGDRGIGSIQFVLASALALLVFLALANIVVFQYGRGVLRSALEQAARAGTTGGAAVCESVGSDVVSDLLGGRMSDGMVLSCAESGGEVTASAAGVFESWTPLMPDLEVEMTSIAVSEP